MARVQIHRAALHELLVGKTGPVGRDLALKAQRVTNAAKRRCPVDSGRLRSSIRYQLRSEGNAVIALIGTDVAYAVFVHEGTRPHFPPPGKLQPWAKRHGFGPGTAGAMPVAWGIYHHGTKGRPFLTEALQAVMGMGVS